MPQDSLPAGYLSYWQGSTNTCSRCKGYAQVAGLPRLDLRGSGDGRKHDWRRLVNRVASAERAAFGIRSRGAIDARGKICNSILPEIGSASAPGEVVVRIIAPW